MLLPIGGGNMTVIITRAGLRLQGDSQQKGQTHHDHQGTEEIGATMMYGMAMEHQASPERAFVGVGGQNARDCTRNT
jgi:hypothetical protein